MNTSSKNNLAYRTCVSITETSPRKTRASLKRALARSEHAEIRFDFLAPSDVPETLELISPYMKRCICTLRPKSEGGKFSGHESERISILKLIAEYSPMLLDVEFNTIRSNLALRRYISRTKTKILVSWHDFKRTPSIGILRGKLDAMSKYSKTVKIVTMAKNVRDSSMVLSLYADTRKIKLIAFCMGDEGRHSRILSLYLGSPFVYVSMGKPVAPGQFSLAEINKFIPRSRTISFK